VPGTAIRLSSRPLAPIQRSAPVRGDYVFGDDDGVLVIPAAEIVGVIERGEAATRREAETRSYLESGKTLDEIDTIRKEGTR
jgi:regulator of RNase E activity RraA